ncbi:unnamed protein product, partial [Symbiodinium microadriaticum]
LCALVLAAARFGPGIRRWQHLGQCGIGGLPPRRQGRRRHDGGCACDTSRVVASGELPGSDAGHQRAVSCPTAPCPGATRSCTALRSAAWAPRSRCIGLALRAGPGARHWPSRPRVTDAQWGRKSHVCLRACCERLHNGCLWKILDGAH